MTVFDHENPNGAIYMGRLESPVKVMGQKTDIGVEINNKVYAVIEEGDALLAVRKRNDLRETHRVEVLLCPHIEAVLPSSLTITEDGDVLCPQCARKKGHSRYFDVHVDIETKMLPYTTGYELEAIVREPWPQPPMPYHNYLGARYPWPHDWRHELDASISGSGGAELISTFTIDSDWLIGEAIVVTAALEKLGWVFSHRAGMHVNIGVSLMLNRFMLIEEAVFALGANVLRYLNSRYATPLKQPHFHSGHHAALSRRSRNVSEIRAFEAAHDLNDISFKVGLANAIAFYLNEMSPPAVDPKTNINEAAVMQAKQILNYAGWYEGGSWTGYPYHPQEQEITVNVVARWGNRIKEYRATLDNEEAILSKIINKLEAFQANITIEDVLEIGGGQIEGGDI